MKTFLTFFFLLNGIFSFAQIQKGDWLVRGEGVTLNQRTGNVDYSAMNFDIALGYFIHKQWMLGSGIALSLTDRATFVKNELFGRYYLKDDSLSRRRMYIEARWEKGDFSFIGAGLSNQRFKTTSAVLAFGIDFFLSEKLALEAQVDYAFFNKVKRFDRVGRMNTTDRLSFDFKLQYFFHYRDFRTERLIDYRNILKEGRWFVGGSVDVKKTKMTRVNNIQEVKPVVGRFMRKNWAIGSRLNYTASNFYERINITLLPFSRYYVNLGRKKKIFAELNAGYGIELNSFNDDDYDKIHALQYGGKVGLSNFINEEVSFDISYAFFTDQTFDRFIADKIRTLSGGGIELGLHYFFKNKCRE